MPQSLPATILIGTRNQAKIDMIKMTFPDVGVKLISLNDIDPVDDSSLVEGMDFVENAKMKSKFYFDKTGIPTLSTDQIQWMEHWPHDNGFIMHIRKLVNPSVNRASDQEVAEWIKNFVKTYGPSEIVFHFGIAYTDEHGTKGFDSAFPGYILVENRSETFREEYVFDQFMQDKKTGEYRVDQSDSVAYAPLAVFFNEKFIPEISK
jgi:inosine/xanthosine triphosphate pyrophosphatase family protein